MAIPFGDYYESEPGKKENDMQQNGNGKENNLCSGTHSQTAKSLQSSQCNINSTQGTNVSTSVYCISNSSFFNCGSTFLKESYTKNKIQKSSTVSKVKLEPGCKIKVRKGIFNSQRAITSEDIRVVAENVEENWKKLLRKLPGLTSDNLIFHQAFVDAMDRNAYRNMAEITLVTWKCVLPEFSTIGNLSQTLFNIGHPHIVTYLKP